MLAFVHNVSPVKKSQNKRVEYFNCQLQTQDQTYQAVSFKLDHKSTLDEASDSKSPVKLSGFKRKANYRNNNIQDVEINKKTNITLLDSTKVSFTHHVAEGEMADIVDVKTISASG